MSDERKPCPILKAGALANPVTVMPDEVICRRLGCPMWREGWHQDTPDGLEYRVGWCGLAGRPE